MVLKEGNSDGRPEGLHLEHLMIKQWSNSKIGTAYSSKREEELGSKEGVSFIVY